MLALTFILLTPIQYANTWYIEVPEREIVITGQFNNSGYDRSILGPTSTKGEHIRPIKVKLHIKEGEKKELKVSDSCQVFFTFEHSILTIKHSHDYMADPLFGVLNIKGRKFYRVKLKENKKSIRPLEYHLDKIGTGIPYGYTPEGLQIVVHVYNYLAGKYRSGADAILVGFGPQVEAQSAFRTRYQTVNDNCRVRIKFNYLCEKKSINPLRFELKCSENDHGGYRFIDVIAEDLKIHKDEYWHTYSKVITTPEGCDDIGVVWRLSTTNSELKYGIYMIDGFEMEYLDIQTNP